MCIYLLSFYKYLASTLTLAAMASPYYVTNNANRMLGFLRRNFALVPASLKLLLYKTLVRSKLEYASSIWDLDMVVLSSSLEVIQNRAARFIVKNYSRTASITSINSFNSVNLLLEGKSRACAFFTRFPLLTLF